MADGSHTTLTAAQPESEPLVAGLRSFAGEHGGATAVIEYVGKRRARIALTGGDGASADHVAPGTDIARSACDEAGIPLEKSWERDLIDQITPGDDLLSRVERRALAR